MRLAFLACLAMGLFGAGAAAAQTPPATIGERYVPAPWWMRDPVIASIGAVRTELPANRATFQAVFQVVERDVDEATRSATERVQALSQAMAAYGADAVRVETTIRSRPLYEQYRDEAGVLRENARSDQIERYEATATVSLQVREIDVLERVYAAVLNARPTSVSAVSFVLEPSNAVKAELAEAAVRDAARRARSSAEAAGSSLGAVRVIDPTGRACQTDVLAGWPSYGPATALATDVDVESIVVTGSRMPRPDLVATAPVTQITGEDVAVEGLVGGGLALQPPFYVLTEQACVVYSLN